MRESVFMLRKRLHAGQSKPSLYADLAEMGGLAPALQRTFDHMAGEAHLIRWDQSAGQAIISDEPRQSTVVAAASERNFHIDFWYKGVLYGSGWTSELEEVARAAVAFHMERAAITEIAARFQWLNSNEPAAFHERGVEFFVTKKWEYLERWVASDQFSCFNRTTAARSRSRKATGFEATPAFRVTQLPVLQAVQLATHIPTIALMRGR